MDRVAQLAEERALAASADLALVAEGFGAWDRAETRKALAEAARNLGFPASEIPSAIDTALKGR